jgi:hypothetical protein
MKNFSLALSILLLCSRVEASPSCPDGFATSTKMSKSSEVYIVRAEAGFNIQGVDVYRFFKKISSRQAPSYKCEFFEHYYGIYYQEGFCVNLQTQKKFPVWENSRCYGAGGACALIYSNDNMPIKIEGTELYHTLHGINVNTDQNWYLIQDCSRGKIEAITLFKLDDEYVIIMNSTETGFTLK